MKQFLILLVTVVLVSAGLFACSGKNKQEDPKTTQSTKLVESKKQDVDVKPKESTTKETTTIQETTKSENETLSWDAIAGLSGQSIPWGSGGGVDADNVPVGCVSYQQQYGKYNADFVRTSADKKKVIYLTSDEGYENGYTSKILDVLKEKKVKAVFFITMPYAKSESALIKRMIDEGHIVGAHSVSHPANGLPSLSLEQQKAEITELHDYVKKTYNYEMRLFRYPAGIFSEQSLAAVQALGYTSVFWSFAYADWDPNNQPDNASALTKTIDSLHPGAIYLLHAVSKTNTEILGDFIDQARAKGYTFEPYY